MLWTKLSVLLTISCLYAFGTARGSDKNCTETEDCIEVIKCIRDYADLETYVINNKTLVERLAEAFFTSDKDAYIYFTGRGASKFVKITYNFQTSNGKHSVEGNVTDCSAQQSTYIWGEAIIYILASRSLYWLTLFAISIDEVDVTMELPCLCNDVYNRLLSRLTYLIKVYAASKYHDHPLQFTSPYYFQTKDALANGSARTTFVLLTFGAIILMLAVSPLTAVYIHPVVTRLIARNTANVEPINESDHFKKLIHWTPLTFTGVVTCIGFLVIHICSLIEINRYSDEVVNRRSNDINIMGVIYPIVSLLTVITGIIFAVWILPKGISKSKRNNNKQWSERIAATVILANVVYLGGYFLPYILMAFIHSPVRTVLTNFMEILSIVCIYWIFLGAWRLFKLLISKKYNRSTKVTKFFNTLLYCCMGWATAFSFIIFIFGIISIVSVGRFEDFEELNGLAPSVLIAVFGLVLLKPAYNYIKHKIKDASKDGEPAAQGANDTEVTGHDEQSNNQSRSPPCNNQIQLITEV